MDKISKREKMITDCVAALHKVNQAHGYSVISQETLSAIKQAYIIAHKSPKKPGIIAKSKIAINICNVTTIRGITMKHQDKQKEQITDVISIFRDSGTKTKKKDSSSDEEEYDFAAIAKRNKENEERLKRDQKKANKGVIRSHRLKT